jgi:maleylacetate reductase
VSTQGAVRGPQPSPPGSGVDGGRAWQAFTWEAPPARVLLGRGALGRVAEEVRRLGAERVMLVGGGGSAAAALARVAADLGDRLAVRLDGAARHVPEAIAASAAERAREAGADAVVSVGGGSATGLGKAVALATGVPLVAVPTTYSGSEMTLVWGRTGEGRKETGRDPRVLPRAVVYDPELCAGMPPRLAGASGMNALAHAAEALWVPGANPVTSVLATAAIRRLVAALPRVVDDPRDLAGHAECLAGACMAGAAFAQVGGGIHHRTCHVLGGGWDLPHAETHAVVLPHAVELVAPTAPEAMAELAAALGGDPASTLDDLRGALGLPGSLAAIGMPDAGLGEAAERIAAGSVGDPLAGDRQAVRTMLEHAQRGDRPLPGAAAAVDPTPVQESRRRRP